VREREYLTAAEAAARLGVSRATLYAYVSRGLLVSEPGVGRERRYPRESLDELTARRERGSLDVRVPALAGGAPVLESAITLIDGERLWYRGRDAVELSRTETFEQVAALLWTGASDDSLFPRPAHRRGGAERGSLPDRLVTCLVDARRAHPVSLSDPGPATLRAAAATVAQLFEAAGARGGDTLAGRLARGWRTSPDDLDAALVLCADHELNTSAFTARCVASTDAPIANVLLAALLALEGRRHGGAVRGEVIDLLANVELLGAERACSKALWRSGSLPGFGGNRAYRHGDPRAEELLSRLDLPPHDPASQAAEFARSLGDTPSLELALAALERSRRLPADAAFTLFALGRSAGWIAHALEAAASGTLIRPRARYSGPPPSRTLPVPARGRRQRRRRGPSP
jgi:citrate synthase